MLDVIQGNVFDAPESTIVITVNVVGAMGKGIALTFKERYPDYYDVYRKACLSGEFKIGDLMLLEGIDDKRFILFPTKGHFKYPSKVEWIELGLVKLRDGIRRFYIRDLALPPLGCGNGGLNFESQVNPLLQKYLGPLIIPCRVYL